MVRMVCTVLNEGIKKGCLCLQQAAKALKVSTGSLKRTSKSLGLARWPYRQRNSLRQLMANAVEYMVSPPPPPYGSPPAKDYKLP